MYMMLFFCFLGEIELIIDTAFPFGTLHSSMYPRIEIQNFSLSIDVSVEYLQG